MFLNSKPLTSKQPSDQKHAKHVKLKLNKNKNLDLSQTQRDSLGLVKAKSPQRMLPFKHQSVTSAKEKHVNLSQILAVKNESRTINTGGILVKNRMQGAMT